MTLDCRPYTRTLSGIKDLLLVNNIPDRGRIGSTAVASMVPIIAVAHFYGSLHGYDVGLDGFIARLCKFYDVDEVIT